MKKLIQAFLPVVACAGVTPARAAPVTTSFNVNGQVPQKCSLPLSTALTPSVTISKTGNNYNYNVTNESSLKITVSCNVKTGLQLRGTALKTNATATGQESQVVNYTATASPWGTPSSAVTTSDTSAYTGATYNGSTASSSTPTSGTVVTISLAGFVIPSGKSTPINNATYSSTITVVLTPGT